MIDFNEIIKQNASAEHIGGEVFFTEKSLINCLNELKKEYEENVVLNFAEWCANEFGKYDQDKNNVWYKHNEDHDNYTTKELFDIFINLK